MKERKKKPKDKESAVCETGHGEVSLSVEETNKLRASLGLKPLEEKKEDTQLKEQREKEEEDKKHEKTAAIRERLQRAKEKRKEEAFFAETKTLGEAESDSDEDLAAWIEKSRMTAPSKDEEKTEQQETSKGEVDAEQSVESDEAPDVAPELAGAKVKHKPDDIKVGESMILTLADQPILTEAGELNATEDALENALKAEDARRQRAYRASKPKKDEGYDEFGDKKSLLSKYDEEEDEAMTLDPLGGAALDSFKPGSSVRQETLQVAMRPISDYLSTGPDGHDRPTKRRRQKLRKKKETDVLDIVGQLEATQHEGSMDWEADHGSRLDRRSRIKQEEQESQELREQKTLRFDKALERANLQALKLKLLEKGDDDEDEELYEALNRAQLAASQQTKTRFSQMAQDAQQRQPKAAPVPENKELVFTDTTEFCRLFSSENTELKRLPSEKVEEKDMDEDVMSYAQSRKDRRRHLRSKGAEVPEDSDIKKEETKQEELGVLREPLLGSGLATALNTLRAKGDLREKFEWVGRTNDMKKSRLIGVDDFYTCGEAEDRMEKSIETALTRKDHLGRVLTPKEAFREISYAFHGKGPSQKTLEKRKRKMNEDFLATRSNLDQESQLERLKAVQKVQGNAFVVLSGAEQPGKEIPTKKKKTTKKTKAHAAGKDAFPSLTPILDRGDTNDPLEGKKKVEAMFGIHPKE